MPDINRYLRFGGDVMPRIDPLYSNGMPSPGQTLKETLKKSEELKQDPVFMANLEAKQREAALERARAIAKQRAEAAQDMLNKGMDPGAVAEWITRTHKPEFSEAQQTLIEAPREQKLADMASQMRQKNILPDVIEKRLTQAREEMPQTEPITPFSGMPTSPTPDVQRLIGPQQITPEIQQAASQRLARQRAGLPPEQEKPTWPYGSETPSAVAQRLGEQFRMGPQPGEATLPMGPVSVPEDEESQVKQLINQLFTEGTKEAKEKADNLRLRKGLANIGEGLTQTGYGLSGIGGVPIKGPVGNEELRKQLAQEEEEIKPVSSATRAMLKQIYGVDVPEGYSAARLKELLPHISDMIEKQSANEVRKADIEYKRALTEKTNQDKYDKAFSKMVIRQHDKMVSDHVMKKIDEFENHLYPRLMAAFKEGRTGNIPGIMAQLSTIAKSIGSETGRLTEDDIMRVVGDLNIPGAVRKVRRWFSNNYSPWLYDNWEKAATAISRVMKVYRQKRVKQLAGQFARSADIGKTLQNVGYTADELENKLVRAFYPDYSGESHKQGRVIRIPKNHPKAQQAKQEAEADGYTVEMY